LGKEKNMSSFISEYQQVKTRVRQLMQSHHHTPEELTKLVLDTKEPWAILHKFVLTCMALANADGGTLYIYSNDHLHIQTLVNQSLGMNVVERDPSLTHSRKIPVYKDDGVSINQQFYSVRSLLSNQTLVVNDIEAQAEFEVTAAKSFDKLHNYRTHSILTIPVYVKSKAIGVLQLVNHKNSDTGQFEDFSPELTALIDVFALHVLSNERVLRFIRSAQTQMNVLRIAMVTIAIAIFITFMVVLGDDLFNLFFFSLVKRA
jgi:transcriptional regulator with GAF, ATPase, and Fis domain